MESKEFIFQIFLEHKDMCYDLFGKQVKKGQLVDAPENGSRTYMNYYAFTQEVLKAYRPEVAAKGKINYLVPCNPSDLSLKEQEDISEMLEAIIEIIHYAKHKRSKKHE